MFGMEGEERRIEGKMVKIYSSPPYLFSSIQT
jgi:hypothetical protein